jgi:phosphoribosylformimino-5-aminoimidazole carboxamide ribotide isomerase
MGTFTIFPAIDLRRGQVVRLKEGDPDRQTTYSSNPAETASRWLAAGAAWLHVVNLDGAFDQPDSANRSALEQILNVAASHGAKVQFGGGLRTSATVETALSGGVERAILGTLAVEQPETVGALIARWGADRIGVSLDARDGQVKVHGWQSSGGLSALDAALNLASVGLRWLVFTDIGRDGLQQGLNLESTSQVAIESGLQVIASGGVAGPQDVHNARNAGLAGVIVGRALYEGRVELAQLLMEDMC